MQKGKIIEDYKIAYENVMIANKMLEQEIERLKEEIKGYEQERERVLNIIEERNHKAIEYIKRIVIQLMKQLMILTTILLD